MRKWTSLALVLVLLCSATLVSAAGLKQGSQGAQVTALQEKLKELKYFSGTVDGVYRKDLMEAVWRYQMDVGLQKDGVAGPKTLSHLGLAAEPQKTAAGVTVSAKGLTVGAKGGTVTAIQQALKQKGYYNKAASGTYDDALWTAVWRFQRDNGMSATGVADGALVKALGLTDTAAAPAPVVVTPTVPAKGLTVGANGGTVTAIQAALKQKGYYNGAVNGTYNDALWTAVWRFQRDNRLGATGVADAALLKALGLTTAVVPEATCTLHYGARGAAVQALQTALKNLGYYRIRVDGIYGKGTFAAVQAFQKNNKLTADGIAGAATLSRLGLAGTVPATDKAPFVAQALKYGSKGASVTALQNALKSLNYYTGTPDGVYGDSTFTAVWWFQKNNKLSPTGAADVGTMALLYGGKAIAK